ncbi:MAG: hypothetical protein K5675_11295, partial [Lachnospiraceae bacterium]|nr:hypothetical protein [Lachnospiraceae bacterium]
MEMVKVIVYGYGRKYKKVKEDLFGCEIVAFADRGKVASHDEEKDIPVILPEQICEYEYDYVAISVLGEFEKIKQQLIGENHVPEDKIISLMLFVKSNEVDTLHYEKTMQDFFFE